MQPYYKRSIQGSSKDQKRSWGHNPSSSRRRRKPPLLQPLATPYSKYLPNHTNKELWNKFSSANQTALDLQLFISNTSSISTIIPNPKIYPTTKSYDFEQQTKSLLTFNYSSVRSLPWAPKKAQNLWHQRLNTKTIYPYQL